VESKRRSFAKSLIRRIVGIIVLGAITWYFTKDFETMTTVTIFFHVLKFALDYIHERVWEKIEWGFMSKDDLNEKEQEIIMLRLKKLGYIE
jgi:uncharacterized membrane protein